MVARGEEEEDKELMDDRVGSGDAREARIRYMVACRWAAGRAGRCRWFLVPLGLGLGLAWAVSLVVTGATGVCALLLGWRSSWSTWVRKV